MINEQKVVKKKMITVQCTTSCGKRLSLYSLLWKEILYSVQPIVEIDEQCTTYCGKRYSLYSVQPIVDRDDHCTANCEKR